MKQIIVSSEPDKNGIIVLEKNDYTHLVSVLRKKTGAEVEVRTPCGDLLKAGITNINRAKKTVTLKVLQHGICLQQDSNPQLKKVYCGSHAPLQILPRIILMQWVLKNAKMDLVVRQAAEIGISHIIPVIGEFSTVKKQNEAQTERHKRIIREARQQSGSPVPTDIFSQLTLDEALEKCAELTCGAETVMLAAYEKDSAEKSLYRLLGKTTEAVVIATGAEGGISREEIEKLQKTGFHIIHFKTNILRAETASLYAAAAVQSALTEVDEWQ